MQPVTAEPANWRTSFRADRCRTTAVRRSVAEVGPTGSVAWVVRTVGAPAHGPQAVRRGPIHGAGAVRWGAGLLLLLLTLIALRPALAAGEDVLPAGEAPLTAGSAPIAQPGPSSESALATPGGAPEAPDHPAPLARRSTLGSKLAFVVYDQAGERYGVSPGLLIALHAVESSATTEGCPVNLAGSGALGSFQFMPATFRAYGVDANEDGRVDACNAVDALFSAARYLQALGADADPTSAGTRRALTRYGTDVARVVALAL